jgi:hypothetical protein
MIDVIVCMMTHPPDVSGQDAETQRRAYQRGDVVSVYTSERLPNPPNMNMRANGTGPGRLRYIRLTDCPGTFEAVKASLTSRVDHEANAIKSGRSTWKGDFPGLLSSDSVKYNELLNGGVTSLTWAEFKSFGKREHDTPGQGRVPITDNDVS